MQSLLFLVFMYSFSFSWGKVNLYHLLIVFYINTYCISNLMQHTLLGAAEDIKMNNMVCDVKEFTVCIYDNKSNMIWKWHFPSRYLTIFNLFLPKIIIAFFFFLKRTRQKELLQGNILQKRTQDKFWLLTWVCHDYPMLVHQLQVGVLRESNNGTG